VDFAEPPDHAAIRDTVAAITRSFGSSYYSGHAEGRIATDELWTALAKQGIGAYAQHREPGFTR